jgi:LPS O-antigen subunit length determinant protein (WzzB/FepE family)
MESSQNKLDQDEFNLNELLKILWGGRRLILWITVAFAIAAGIAAWLLPKRYDATILVAPVSNVSGGTQLGGLSSLVSQFGGLASLAGLSASGDSKRSESLAVLQSEALTEGYLQANNLLPVLYERDWDPQRMQWKEHDPKKIPTVWKANQYFKKNIRKVTTDSKSGLILLTIRWKNAATAAKWANDLVKTANDYLRNKAITESERNIAYLNNEAAKTNIVEARQAIYSIMQAEINKGMLARGNEEYAFKVLDPASVPEKPSSPHAAIIVLIGIVGGLLVAAFVVLVRSA